MIALVHRLVAVFKFLSATDLFRKEHKVPENFVLDILKYDNKRIM